jgi:hypothetical protein
MNVNRGILQGSLISTLLFNIYIDDLVAELKKNSFDVLAYADDIAIICDKEQLDKCMKVFDEWSMNSRIDANKKKSGILVYDGKLSVEKDYSGFLIVNASTLEY